MKMREYKFRAECLIDVIRLLELFNYNNHGIPCGFIMTCEDTRDLTVEVELSIELEKSKLAKIMDEVVDGHRMWQTLNSKEKYSGEIIRYNKY